MDKREIREIERWVREKQRAGLPSKEAEDVAHRCMLGLNAALMNGDKTPAEMRQGLLDDFAKLKALIEPPAVS